jgi:hypothetical protein
MAARTKPGAAGVLIFVADAELPRFMAIIQAMNEAGAVSREVLQLYCVRPTRDATRALSLELQQDAALQHLEQIQKLKPNNSLRDLTAPWRLHPDFCAHYYLLVGLETVSEELKDRYPHPNLTLQAGKIEEGESPLEAAKRELYEEARICCKHVAGPPVTLMSKGMFMYYAFVEKDTTLHMVNDTLYIGYPPLELGIQ